MYVHTRNDEIIYIDSETRIPRSYNRFVGLMEQLFLIGGVPPDDPLIKLEKGKNLSDLVAEISANKTISFIQEGRKVSKRVLFDKLDLDDDLCVIIGGFPHGDFLSDVESLSDDLVSIYSESLDAVTVISHVIQAYEGYFLSDYVFI